MKIKVEITEVLQKTIEVEAESKSEAINKAKEQYYNGEVELDASDFVDTEFEIIQEGVIQMKNVKSWQLKTCIFIDMDD